MAAQSTSNLALPYVMAGQAQKHVTVNEGLRRLDALAQTAVESRSVASEPAQPTDGVVYILPPGASGAAWSLMSHGRLAYHRDGAWTEIAPQSGWRAWARDEGALLAFDGAAWIPAAALLAEGPSGAATRMMVTEAEATLAGAATDAGVVIPARAVVFAVTTRTLEAVTGAAAYDCGVTGEPDKFGGDLGAAAGSTNIGVVGPTAYYADTPVRLTAKTADFTGGRVRTALHFARFDPPGL